MRAKQKIAHGHGPSNIFASPTRGISGAVTSLLLNVHLDGTDQFYFWFYDDFDRRLAHVNCVRVLRPWSVESILSIVRSHCMQSKWISWNNFNSAIVCAINTTVLVVCCVSLLTYPEVSMKLLLIKKFWGVEESLQLICFPLKNQCFYFMAANSVF